MIVCFTLPVKNGQDFVFFLEEWMAEVILPAQCAHCGSQRLPVVE